MRDTLWMVRYTLAHSMRADRRVTIAAGAMVVVSAGVPAAIGIAQRGVITHAAGRHMAALLAAVALGMIAYAIQLMGERISHNYRNDLCNRIQLELEQDITELTATIPTVTHLDHSDFLNRITMLRRGTQALAGTGWAAASVLSALVGIAGSLWLLAAVHPALILLAVCALPIVPVASRARKAQRDAIDSTSELLRQERALHDLCVSPEPAKEIWISRNGLVLDQRASALWNQAAMVEARARFRGIIGEVGAWTLYLAALTGALLLLGHLHTTGDASVGDLVMAISLAGQLRIQQATAVQAINRFADGGRSATHHRWLRDYAQQARADGSGIAPMRLVRGIELRNVSFAYPGTDTLILDNISLVIPAGTTLGLVGINGAGKSTLVKLLIGVHRPTMGCILVDGVDLATFDPPSWAARCAGTLQDFLKLQVPVREAVGVGDLRRITDMDRIRHVIDRAGATSLVTDLPDGIETQLGRLFDGAELSHGQWQRLALARGQMRDSALLLVLDEPTAALDAQAEHDAFELFAGQARESSQRGAVTLLISHRFSTVHMADKIVVISHGKITEEGSHDELLAMGGDYANLYQTQMRAYASLPDNTTKLLI